MNNVCINFAKIQHFFLITKQICIFFCIYEKKYLKMEICKMGCFEVGGLIVFFDVFLM